MSHKTAQIDNAQSFATSHEMDELERNVFSAIETQALQMQQMQESVTTGSYMADAAVRLIVTIERRKQELRHAANLFLATVAEKVDCTADDMRSVDSYNRL